MTNRKDMIDPALLRPGRLEVHVEIVRRFACASCVNVLVVSCRVCLMKRAVVKSSPSTPGTFVLASVFARHSQAACVCRRMRENGLMGSDVDLAKLASLSKNFSGAEIEGTSISKRVTCPLNCLIDLQVWSRAPRRSPCTARLTSPRRRSRTSPISRTSKSRWSTS
jgi:vesicle-fusing ATPase